MDPRKEPLPSSDERVRGERRRAPLPAVAREDLIRRKRQLFTTTAPISVQEHQHQPPVLPQRASGDQPHRDREREDESGRATYPGTSKLPPDQRGENHAGQCSDDAGDARYDQGARANSADNVDVAESGEVVRRRKRRRISPPTQAPPEYLNRRELLGLVPLCMSSIDTLEKAGIFPSRFVLSPTTRVAWKRKEVVQFLEQRAAKRVHAVRSPEATQGRTDLITREHSDRRVSPTWPPRTSALQHQDPDPEPPGGREAASQQMNSSCRRVGRRRSPPALSQSKRI